VHHDPDFLRLQRALGKRERAAHISRDDRTGVADDVRLADLQAGGNKGLIRQSIQVTIASRRRGKREVWGLIGGAAC